MSYVTPTYPRWLPDAQNWAIDQERWRHDQALYTHGEYAMFVLLWDVRDHEKGLVGRCPTCYLSQGKIAEVYQQASDARCLDCYGTTFEGGYKAKLVRPTMWNYTGPDEEQDRRGMTVRATATVQTTGDFDLDTDDFVFRADGSRWQIGDTGTDRVSTGFSLTSSSVNSVGQGLASVVREDESSVAYLIPPDTETLKAALDVRGVRYPLDFSAVEEIVGPIQG